MLFQLKNSFIWSVTLLLCMTLFSCDPRMYLTIQNETEQAVIICYKTQQHVMWTNIPCDTLEAEEHMGHGLGLGVWPKGSGKDFVESIESVTFYTDIDSLAITRKEIPKRVKAKVKGIFNDHLKIVIKD